MPSDEFYSYINKFISTFERCYRDFLRDRESAERAAKREALKAKKAQMTKKLTTGRASILKSSSSNSVQDPNSGVDDILQTVRDGDAFKQRRQRKVNPNGSQRGDKGDSVSSIDKLLNGHDSQRGERSGENGSSSSSSNGIGGPKKKDVQVAAKALTIVMRSRQNYSRIDQFSFGNDEKH
ncbi:hypothetical protein PPL_01050 [Heterostelium album PN500]|uniref:Uncharacterized protein n=1 Tax=Heterostelium pallidum (strain ATCC 26659 / Pp 5 / PN500) TaxID=670386 RepID=D3AXZ2_HETP5|nr:hypothetical protein PPL_01050 [Heterostelium album PN500]EFA85819.1 hypothetical protein PPL_01050 [Heterostelium album PN500]|eukprot:XP_020437925.1 hypothetical protein PPL_01050 [Heterostelium album PN500]